MTTSKPQNSELYPPGTRLAVVCDLDGTLCNCEHRRHFVTRECVNCGGTETQFFRKRGKFCAACGERMPQKDWETFKHKLVDDTPNMAVATVLNAMKQTGYAIIFATGRDERFREMTESWLKKWSIVRHNELYMRPNDDNRDDVDIKRTILDQMLEDKYQPVVIFDDRDRVVQMWRDLDYTCFQVAPINF